MPMRPLTLPSQSDTWRAVEGLLDGFELLYQLSSCESLLAWNVKSPTIYAGFFVVKVSPQTVGVLRASSIRCAPSRLPYIRSLAQVRFSSTRRVEGIVADFQQTIFSDGSTVLSRFAASWLVEHFFLELAHISFGHIVTLFEPNSFGLTVNSFEEFHSQLTRVGVSLCVYVFELLMLIRPSSMSTVVSSTYLGFVP